MRQYALLLVAISAYLTCTTALAQQPEAGLGEVVRRAPIDTPDAPLESTEPEDDVLAAIEQLTLPERVAQLMLVTLNGLYRPDSGDRELFKKYPPGGIVIPAVSRPIHAVQYISALRSLPIESVRRISLFITGNIYNLTQHDILPDDAFLHLPSMMAMAAADYTEATEATAELVAQHMATMGFNMHLGPSLALSSTLPGARRSIHSFGGDPELTAKLSGTFFEAFEANDILPVAMGFPGGGANRIGKDPAVLLTPKSVLFNRDLLPYVRAIEQDVPFIHVANTIVPTLDPSGRPASMSPEVIINLLQNTLRFSGIVIAGPADSFEIGKRYPSVTAAVNMFKAGADMVYLQGEGFEASRVIEGVTQAVMAGHLSEGRINAALYRVLSAKVDQELIGRPMPDAAEANKLEKLSGQLEEAYPIDRRSITLIQNQEGVLPLSKGRSLPLGVTGTFGVKTLRENLEPYLKRVAQYTMGNATELGRIQDFEIERLTSKARGMRTAVCVVTGALAPQGVKILIDEYHKINIATVLILLGMPQDITPYLEADAIILTYSSLTSVEQTMDAVTDILVGNAPVKILPAQRPLRRNVNDSIAFNALDVVLSPTGKLPTSLGNGFPAGFAVPYNPVLALEKVEWQFGDGKKSKDAQATHAYSEPGAYTVTLSIKDDEGRMTTGDFSVVIE